MLKALTLACLFAATAVGCASANALNLRGHYYWGHEVETFQPCDSKLSFWVLGDDVLLQPLRDKAAEVALAKGEPYQPIYIEASGVSEGKASDGFATDYAGVYRLTAVNVVHDTGSTGCRAHG